jgi:hypothetical protein
MNVSARFKASPRAPGGAPSEQCMDDETVRWRRLGAGAFLSYLLEYARQGGGPYTGPAAGYAGPVTNPIPGGVPLVEMMLAVVAAITPHEAKCAHHRFVLGDSLGDIGCVALAKTVKRFLYRPFDATSVGGCQARRNPPNDVLAAGCLWRRRDAGHDYLLNWDKRHKRLYSAKPGLRRGPEDKQ